MTLSIVIPTYGRTTSLARLLESIAQQTVAADEVIVVDQNAEGTLDSILLASGIETLVHIRLDEANAAAARNAGFAASSSTHVVFVDDDEVLESDFVSRVRETFASHAPVLCLWPVIYQLDRAAALRRWRRIASGKSPEGSTLFPVQRVGAGGIAFEREYFRSIGGYDETLFRFGRMSEDWELSLRMQRRGLTIWLNSSLFVRHEAAVEGGCAIRSAPYRDTRERRLRVLLATLRIASGAPFRLGLQHVWTIIRVGLLSSLGRPGGRLAVLRNPLWHLRAIARAIVESREFAQRHAARYADPTRVEHLTAPTYHVVSMATPNRHTNREQNGVTESRSRASGHA